MAVVRMADDSRPDFSPTALSRLVAGMFVGYGLGKLQGPVVLELFGITLRRRQRTGRFT